MNHEAIAQRLEQMGENAMQNARKLATTEADMAGAQAARVAYRNAARVVREAAEDER